MNTINNNTYDDRNELYFKESNENLITMISNINGVLNNNNVDDSVKMKLESNKKAMVEVIFSRSFCEEDNSKLAKLMKNPFFTPRIDYLKKYPVDVLKMYLVSIQNDLINNPGVIKLECERLALFAIFSNKGLIDNDDAVNKMKNDSLNSRVLVLR